VHKFFYTKSKLNIKIRNSEPSNFSGFCPFKQD
jgi:hypothetical protein